MHGSLTPRAMKSFSGGCLAGLAHTGAICPGANRDAYRVWVAEIMLQQTRIAAVMPYYERFLERFPTVEALAGAAQDDVLRLWSGLGYYSRARNLHRAAQEIVARHGGEFPRKLDAALALPGIGRYTAAAVLSIAYDVPLAVLDGNVARVLARLARFAAICANRGAGAILARRRIISRRACPHVYLPGGARRLEPGADGIGRVGLHAAQSALRRVSCGALVPCRARGMTRNSGAAKEARAVRVRIAAAILRDRAGARCWCRILARTTASSSRACGNSLRSKWRGMRSGNLPRTLQRRSV